LTRSAEGAGALIRKDGDETGVHGEFAKKMNIR